MQCTQFPVASFDPPGKDFLQVLIEAPFDPHGKDFLQVLIDPPGKDFLQVLIEAKGLQLDVLLR